MSLVPLFRKYRSSVVLSGVLAALALVFVIPKVLMRESASVLALHPYLYTAFLILGGSILWIAYRRSGGLRDWHRALGEILLATYPAVVVFLVGLSVSSDFHYLFNIALAGYALLAVLWFLRWRYSWMPTKPEAPLSFRRWIAGQGFLTWVFLVAIAVSYAFFALNGIARFAAVDEPLWVFQRIPKTFHNLQDLNWYGTKVSDKPGATVAYLSGLGYVFGENPKAYEPKKGPGRNDTPTQSIEPLNFAFRLPVAVFTALSLFLFYFIMERLFGRASALLGTAFIGTAPFLIGISRIVNPDSLLWVFAPLSVMAFLLYQRSHRPWALFLAGLLLGFALLTKYVANLLFVFFFGLMVAEYWFRSTKETAAGARAYVKRAALDYLTLTLLAIAVMIVCYPYSWVQPSILLNATLLSQAFEQVWPWFVGLLILLFLDYRFRQSRLFDACLGFLGRFRETLVAGTAAFFVLAIGFVLLDTYLGMRWLDFEAVLASPKTAHESSGLSGIFLANFYPLIFGIHPLATLFFTVSLGFLWWHRKSRDWSMRVRWYLLLFIFFYYLGSAVNEVAAIARYQIMVYPLAYLVAALGAMDTVRFIIRRWPSLTFLIRPAAVLLFILFLLSLARIQPHFLAYASILLPERYYLDIKDMGTGSYEAAVYLNSLPDVANLVIWTDKSGVCAFFKGAACHNSYNFEALSRSKIDYVVVSAGRKSRTDNMLYYPLHSKKPQPYFIRFDKYYGVPVEEAIWSLSVGGRPSNFIKIIPFRQEWTGDASRFD